MTNTEIIAALKSGNDAFIKPSTARRAELVKGQHPLAAVLTCSDSRVVPEEIFSVSLGELFVIRTAGNVVSDFESGSVEYAAGHLGVTAIIVMGHTHCGAVGAAREGGHHGETVAPHGLNAIISEITRAISGTKSAAEAVRANVNNSVNRLLENREILELLDEGKAEIYKAVYDIETGKVEFFQ